MKLHIIGPALREITHAARWYERKSIGLGRRFHAQVVSRLADIEQHPRRCARVEWTKVSGEVRRTRIPRFPYVLVYQIVSEEAFVVACSHTSRWPGYWRRRLRRDE
jgi:hypothetical protein